MTRKQLFLVTGAMVLALWALTSTQSNDPLDWSDAVVHTVENVGKTEARVLRARRLVHQGAGPQPGMDAGFLKALGARCTSPPA